MNLISVGSISLGTFKTKIMTRSSARCATDIHAELNINLKKSMVEEVYVP
jgi:hypothetical protein